MNKEEFENAIIEAVEAYEKMNLKHLILEEIKLTIGKDIKPFVSITTLGPK